jgi:tetratricopeptide (TPR) repeat protein
MEMARTQSPVETAKPDVGVRKTRPRRRATTKGASWRSIVSWGRRILAVVTIVPSTVVLLALLLSLAEYTLQPHSIDLDTIEVPEALSKTGFTSEIATRRLRDAIQTVQGGAAGRMSRAAVIADQDLPTATVPKTGISLKTLAAAIRSLVPAWQHEVSGEFIPSGKGLSLRLRLNGQLIFSETTPSIDVDAAEALLGNGVHGGAFKIIQETQPSLAASILYAGGRGDIAAASLAADLVINSLPPDDENVPWAFNLKGVIAEDRGDIAQAVALLKKAPMLAAAHVNLGDIYDDQKNPDEAIKEYQAAIRLDPKFAGAHVNLGYLYQRLQKPDAAIAEYQLALRLDPKSAAPHTNLGLLYADQGHLDDARAEYQLAILLDPKNATPHNGLGVVYAKQDKPDDAIAEFRNTIQLDPKYAFPHNNLGQLYNTQGNPDGAIAEFQLAIQLDPKFALPHNGLGEIYADQNKPDDAIAEFRSAIQLDPKDPSPHSDLGQLYADHGNPEGAITEYQLAIQLDPKLAAPHIGLGVVYDGQGRLDDAIAEFRSAIQLDPENPMGYANLGHTLQELAASSAGAEKLQRLQDACQAFIQASKLASDDPSYTASISDIDGLMKGQGHCAAGGK